MAKLYQFLKKNGLVISALIGLVLSLVALFIITGSYPNAEDGTPMTPKQLVANNTGIFDFGLYTTYFLSLLAMALAAIFPLVYLVQNFKDSAKSLIGFGVIVVLVILGLVLGSAEIPSELLVKFPDLKESTILGVPTMKVVDGSIYLIYILMVISLVVAVLAAVRDFSKQ